MKVHNLSKFLLELSLIEYPLASVPASLLASASLFLSRKIFYGVGWVRWWWLLKVLGGFWRNLGLFWGFGVVFFFFYGLRGFEMFLSTVYQVGQLERYPSHSFLHHHSAISTVIPPFQNSNLTYHSSYNEDTILPVASRLARLLTTLSSSKLQATQRKYAVPKFHNISRSDKLQSPVVQQLASLH